MARARRTKGEANTCCEAVIVLPVHDKEASLDRYLVVYVFPNRTELQLEMQYSPEHGRFGNLM